MGFRDASVTVSTEARRLLRYLPRGLVRVSHVSRGTAVCSHRYWDRFSSHSRDVVVGTPDRRCDQFVLTHPANNLGKANIVNAIIRTAAITSLAESNPLRPTRLRRSERRLRHNPGRSHQPHPPNTHPIRRLRYTMEYCAKRRDLICDLHHKTSRLILPARRFLPPLVD